MIVFFICGSCFCWRTLPTSYFPLTSTNISPNIFDRMNMQCVGPLHQWDHLKETRLASAHLANGCQMNRKGINHFTLASMVPLSSLAARMDTDASAALDASVQPRTARTPLVFYTLTTAMTSIEHATLPTEKSL